VENSLHLELFTLLWWEALLSRKCIKSTAYMQIIWENLGAKLFYIFLNGVFLSGLHNIL
jgi:hypothetical protein